MKEDRKSHISKLKSIEVTYVSLPDRVTFYRVVS